MRASRVVGSADGFRARRTAGETRETPRTAHAPVAQLAKGGGGGVPQPTAPGLSSPSPRSLSCVRQRAAAGSSSVHSLALEGSALITRAAVLSLSLPPFLLYSFSLPLPLYLCLALSFSLFIPPTRCVCLFIVVFWEIPDTRVTESHTRAAPRYAARAAACIPILELHPVGSRIPPRLRRAAGWRYAASVRRDSSLRDGRFLFSSTTCA